MNRRALIALTACAIGACDRAPTRVNADVIVIGAGIAGISAALEASDAGASVLVVEWSSVPGGHAVEAGGFALVDTPLQRAKGHADSPDIAYRDLVEWGGNPDEQWARQFAARSRSDVHDWLAGMGVKFSILLPTPDHSVPRFHFAGGTAVNAIVPMLRTAFGRDNIRWLMNSRVDSVAAIADDTLRVTARNVRSDTVMSMDAAAVVLATGGFQGNLQRVRRFWPDDIGQPERILHGAGHFATGDGIELGQLLGAGVVRLRDQVTFVDGMPNPRNPERGLLVQNPAGMRVDTNGARFVDETAVDKDIIAAVLALPDQTHWMIFDEKGLKRLRIRGAEWVDRATIRTEILENPAVFAMADSIAELADKTGLPAAALQASVEEFGTVTSPPFYAVQLYPMSRKSLGGIAIDSRAQALDADGDAVPGVFAAGELTGVGGINGRHGGSGTFLAPSVLIGRTAGRGAAKFAAARNGVVTGYDTAAEIAVSATAASLEPERLADLVELDRKGYWHFEQAHRVVLERGYDCVRCHAVELTPLDSCTTCH